MTRLGDGGEAAHARLERALDMMEARIGRQLQAMRSGDALRQEIETLSSDRSRLAQELDRAQAHVARLDAAAGHAEERVTSAIGTIQGLLKKT